MADEQDLNQETPDTPEVPEQAQLSPVEARAAEQGWVPQDEWQGDPDSWRPAKEFLDRGELFKKIDDQKRELKQLKQAMDEFGKHHAKVQETAYKKAIEDLKAQKVAAISDGDAEAVVEIDDRIDDLKEQAKAAKEVPTVQETQEPHPAFQAWEQRNGWYKTERAMKIFADEVAKDMVAAGEREPVKILQEVDRQMRKEFPNKFVNPNREKAGTVEGSTNKGGKRSDSFELSDDERRIMNRIVATGVMTKEKYIEELKATKGRGA